MIHLVMKDFYVNKTYNLLILLYLGFLLFSKGTSAPAIIFGMSIVSYGMLTRSCFNDDKDRGDIFLRTLPIKASTIVVSKYLFGILVLLVAAVLFVLLAFFGGQNLSIYYASMGVAALSISLVYSIYLPVFFKYGYMKARTFQTIFFLAIMAVSFSLKSLIDIAKSSIPISKGQWLIAPMVNFIETISGSNTLLMVITCAASLVMLTISMILSLKFYDTGKH